MMLFGHRPDSSVRGERGIPAVARTISLQSRLSNVLALCLVLGIGAMFLCWYYIHMAGRPARTRRSLQVSAAERAGGDTALPSLGSLYLPAAVETVADVHGAGAVPAAVALPGPTTSPIVNPIVTMTQTHVSAWERRLSGVAFAAAAPDMAVTRLTPVATQEPAAGAPADALSTLLTTIGSRAASAELGSAQRMLLPKGAFIDCTLETAIDSTLPGLTTCVTATDTFSADGRVVLLERGTKLVGETRGQMQQGSSRVFVLWNEARTPTGVVVPLDSPGADELGRSGLPGQVERHFWERFGAAILISTIDGGVQAAVQSSNRGSGTVIYSPAGPQDVMSEVLKNTLNVPPTVIKRNGDRIQILVARAVDFSRVYELRHAPAQP
jgi:type IV secretion system protein VirB10